jgi:hypothetical protein
MEEILFGSIIVWVLGRIAKKKADAPAPGTIDLPRQGRTQQFLLLLADHKALLLTQTTKIQGNLVAADLGSCNYHFLPYL